jgi:hypothetical protein
MVLAVMSSSGLGKEIHRISSAQNEQAVTDRLDRLNALDRISEGLTDGPLA